MAVPVTCLFEVQAVGLGWARPYRLPLYHRHEDPEVKIVSRRLGIPRKSRSHRAKRLNKIWPAFRDLILKQDEFKHGDFRY